MQKIMWLPLSTLFDPSQFRENQPMSLGLSGPAPVIIAVDQSRPIKKCTLEAHSLGVKPNAKNHVVAIVNAF